VYWAENAVAPGRRSRNAGRCHERASSTARRACPEFNGGDCRKIHNQGGYSKYANETLTIAAEVRSRATVARREDQHRTEVLPRVRNQAPRRRNVLPCLRHEAEGEASGKFCHACGAELRKGAEYCHACARRKERRQETGGMAPLAGVAALAGVPLRMRPEATSKPSARCARWPVVRQGAEFLTKKKSTANTSAWRKSAKS